MKKTYPYLKINVTQEEKDKIDFLAKQENLSTSAYLKSKLSRIFENDDITISIPTEKEKRNKMIKIPLSNSEYEIIKKNARDKTVTRYIRDSAIHGSKTLIVQVYDEDIFFLIQNLQPKIQKILNQIAFYGRQEKIHPQQLQVLLNLLEDIIAGIRIITSRSMKERNSLKQSSLRALNKRIDYSLKNEENSRVPSEIKDYIKSLTKEAEL